MSRGGGGKRTLRHVTGTPARRPQVTVVIPAYNYGRYLGECAQSVLTQRDVTVRLIIADDCSNDDTVQVTDRLARSDRRVHVIRNPENRGHLPTVNAALSLVETEYLVKLDADDLLPPGALARATALLAAQPHLAFVYGRPRHFTGTAPRLRDAAARSWTIWSGDEWVRARCRDGANVISQPEVVMRTAPARQAGFFCGGLPHTSDLYLWMRLAALGGVGRINGPAQGMYRVHDQSMQRTVHAGIMVDLTGRRDAFDAAARTNPAPLTDELHHAARRSLAVTALRAACRAYDRGHLARAEASCDGGVTDLPVDELVAFALETCPEVRRLQAWGALERRRAVGARRAARHPRFFAGAVSRRVGEQMRQWQWLRTGEY